MANRLVKILLVGMFPLFVLTSCKYDLDVSGVMGVGDNVNVRFIESMQWNDDNSPRIIGTTDDNYTILFGGDSHVGGTENVQKLVEIANDSFALAIVIAGDVTTGKEDDYEVADSFLGNTGIVQTCLVAGNHDLYFEGWKSFYNLFGSSTYTMEIISSSATDLYIFLDTGSGTLGNLQLDWLKDVLESERENYRYVIVTTHLNFFRNRMTGSTNPLNEELLVLLDLFEKHKVNLLISGHDHDRYIEEFGHTTYITLDAMKDGVEQASYMELKVGVDGLSYSFVDF